MVNGRSLPKSPAGMSWRLCVLGLLWLLPGLHTAAQEDGRADEIIGEILSQLGEENEGEADYTDLYDDLTALAERPLDLNRTTREELETLPFLSDIQIENLLYYRYRYGDLHSVYELRLVEGMDERTIGRLLPFVCVKEHGRTADRLYAREVWRHGRHDLYLYAGGNTERARGYTESEERPRAYAGSPLQHRLKYRFHYKNRILAGLTAEKDAGEPFFRHGTGYDFVSAYAQANDIGRHVKTLVAGDFRANFGEGLVVRTGFGMGRSSQVLNLNRPPAGLRKSSSTDEYRFLRGAGATVRLGRWDVTAFCSYKKIDGDTAGGCFTSIGRTGLHRTEGERRRRHTVGQVVAGGDATFTRHRLQVGATAVHTRLSHTLVPEPTLYNATAFSGRRQTTAGVHYRFRLGTLTLFGETALTGGLAAATVNGLSATPASRVGLVVLHRYLSPRYDNPHARIFGSSSSSPAGNEHGLYIGAEVRPLRRWKVSLYADLARFPWLKHGVASPSTAGDYLLQADFTPQADWQMYVRAGYRRQAANDTRSPQPTESVITRERWSWRYATTRVYGAWRFQTLLYANLARRGRAAWTYGVSALQDVSYSFRRLPLRLDLRYQFFDARAYDNRIYSYERDVLHAFAIPAHYGVGSRCYLNLRYSPLPRLSLWLKIARTTYADGRLTTGSGHDTTPGHHRTTLRLLLRFSW